MAAPEQPDWMKLLEDPFVQQAVKRVRNLIAPGEDPANVQVDYKQAIKGFILAAYWDHEITGKDAAVLLKRLDAS